MSLKRLYPSGEDKQLKQSNTVILTKNELELYEKWHNQILVINDSISGVDFLKGTHKETLGMNTDYYDWKQNSAGQDNIGKIILAILSFKRLKEKYPDDYTGGILAIDELDATLYPASQLKLIKALRKFSANYNIQVIFTTHSLTLIEKACELQKDQKLKEQVRVVFLRKLNNKVEVVNKTSFSTIKNNLKITLELPDARKIRVFTEDNEARVFVKALLKRKITVLLKFMDCNLSCNDYAELASRKFPLFTFPDSMIILDGDVINNKKLYKKVKKFKNIIILPGDNSPERILAKYLNDLDDSHNIWNHDLGFTKQYCFKDISLKEILEDREKAKTWFNKHYRDKVWGIGASKLINSWAKDNENIVKDFIDSFRFCYNRFAKELGWETLQ